MEPCKTCKGSGHVTKRNPVLHTILRSSCPDCLASGKMDYAIELEEKYHQEWWDSYQKETQTKTFRQ